MFVEFLLNGFKLLISETKNKIPQKLKKVKKLHIFWIF